MSDAAVFVPVAGPVPVERRERPSPFAFRRVALGVRP